MRAGGLSDETVRLRVHHVRRLARELPVAEPKETISAILIAWCANQRWGPETRHSNYSSFRSFFGWLASENGTPDPSTALPRVRRSQGRPRPIPEDELRTAISQADARTQLILIIAASLGLRRSEIAQINRSDIIADLTGFTLVVHGKGGRTRDVPMPDWLTRTISASIVDEHGWLFPGAVGGHLSAPWISELAGRVLPTGWTLHTLRHRFATQAYQSERDLLTVQRLLGHRSVATTQRYAEPPADAMRSAINAASLRI